jgi:2,4-dienoyl-CoA reductase-like NADH-dependent reductase (Old Yellow Enzyme family)
MKQNLIVMLTHSDETVQDAKEVFLSCRSLDIADWGFKDVGLPKEQMKDLVQTMKAAGKTVYLEVVSLSEAEGLAGAEIAIEFGFDILMGTVYFDSIRDLLKGTGVKYYPFAGKVYGHPSILDGTPEEVVAHAKSLQEKGVEGLDLLSYRYTGDAPALLAAVVAAVDIPVVSAGSIDSFDRIDETVAAGADGLTMGSALFDGKFEKDGTFADNLKIVCDYMKNGRSQ